MKNYKVTLTRSYNVIIQARTKIEAQELTEFFIGDCEDLSTVIDKKKKNFSIESIEPVLNEAFEAQEIM